MGATMRNLLQLSHGRIAALEEELDEFDALAERELHALMLDEKLLMFELTEERLELTELDAEL